MSERNGAEKQLPVCPENVWPELDSYARSQVVTLLLQTAFEIITACPHDAPKDEVNERTENPDA